MDHNKRLVKNILSLGVVQVANYVLPLVSIPIIVRIIGPGNFGTINYYNSFIAYFILLINYGFDYSGTRFIATDQDNVLRRNQQFTKILMAKALLFLVSIVVFTISILLISKSHSETTVAIYTFLIVIAWVLSPNWFYQGMQELTSVAIFNLVSKTLFTVLILLMIRKRDDYILQPLILSLTQIAIALVSLLYAIKKFGIVFKRTSIRAVLKLLWDDRMLFFSMLSTNLYTDTNIVVLGLFETREHVGYFTAAWKLIFVFLVVISFPISQALFPYIANSFAKNIQEGLEKIRRVLPLIIYFSLICSAVLYLSSQLLVTGFYGHSFQPAVKIFRILCIVPVLSFINTVLGLQTMVNLKMDRPYFVIIFSGGIFSIVFNIVMLHFYGYTGSAWSWIFAETIIAAMLWYCLRSRNYNPVNPARFNPRVVLQEAKTLVMNIRKPRP